MYQNYIFYLYGTLVDIHTDENDPIVWEKLALFYGYYGAFYQPQELKDSYFRLVGQEKEGKQLSLHSQPNYNHEANPEIQIERVFEKLFTEKGKKAKNGLAIYAGQFFRVLTTEYICLYQGVIPMLKNLQKKGKNIYLLSNAQRIFTEYELVMLGIIRYFNGIMISSDYGIKKPELRFFELLLEKYNLDKNESIMIGNDGTCDIDGGKRAGMDTYYIHSNLSPKDIEKVDATYIQMEMDMEKFCHVLKI